MTAAEPAQERPPSTITMASARRIRSGASRSAARAAGDVRGTHSKIPRRSRAWIQRTDASHSAHSPSNSTTGDISVDGRIDRQPCEVAPQHVEGRLRGALAHRGARAHEAMLADDVAERRRNPEVHRAHGLLL